MMTRAELHKLVWSRSMVSVADELGISDVLLGRRCRQADVPTPPPGHWTRVQNGKRVVVPPLPTHRSPDELLLAFDRPLRTVILAEVKNRLASQVDRHEEHERERLQILADEKLITQQCVVFVRQIARAIAYDGNYTSCAKAAETLYFMLDLMARCKEPFYFIGALEQACTGMWDVDVIPESEAAELRLATASARYLFDYTSSDGFGKARASQSRPIMEREFEALIAAREKMRSKAGAS